MKNKSTSFQEDKCGLEPGSQVWARGSYLVDRLRGFYGLSKVEQPLRLDGGALEENPGVPINLASLRWRESISVIMGGVET